jgi:DNA-directed RNA polymerase subunit M/transcription elongation factor TFIIS
MINFFEPKLRFNKIISENKKDRFNPDSKSVFPRDYNLPFDYKCSNCDYKVSIKNEDLKKHSEKSYSNLNEKDRELIEKFILENKLDKFSFIDFYCPKCSKPIRILFESWNSGFIGKEYELKGTIEIER